MYIYTYIIYITILYCKRVKVLLWENENSPRDTDRKIIIVLLINSVANHIKSFGGLPGNVIDVMQISFQTSAVGPGGVKIHVVIVLVKFLKHKNTIL